MELSKFLHRVFSQPFNADNTRIENVVDPVNDQDSATKKFVDDGLALKANLSHPHLEADITDLDHNAIKFQGVSIDIPGTGDDGNFYQFNVSTNNFDLIHIDGLEDVTPENPIATLEDIWSKIACDETVSTTTSEAYQEKLTLEFTVPIAGWYMVLWSCEAYNSVANKGVRIRIQIDDTTTHNESTIGYVLSNEYAIMTGFFRVYIDTTGSHNIDLDFSRQTGSPSFTAGIRRARLYIKKSLL